eukprot:7387591-Prymnesium_polylepis.1
MLSASGATRVPPARALARDRRAAANGNGQKPKTRAAPRRTRRRRGAPARPAQRSGASARTQLSVCDADGTPRMGLPGPRSRSRDSAAQRARGSGVGARGARGSPLAARAVGPRHVRAMLLGSPKEVRVRRVIQTACEEKDGLSEIAPVGPCWRLPREPRVAAAPDPQRCAPLRPLLPGTAPASQPGTRSPPPKNSTEPAKGPPAAAAAHKPPARASWDAQTEMVRFCGTAVLHPSHGVALRRRTVEYKGDPLVLGCRPELDLRLHRIRHLPTSNCTWLLHLRAPFVAVPCAPLRARAARDAGTMPPVLSVRAHVLRLALDRALK